VSTFNIGHFLTQNARRFRDHPGVVVSERAFTWLEVDRRVNRLANALAAAGIRPGDRILVQARNSHGAFEVKWACFKLGAVWVPVNFRLTPAEVAYMAGHASARAIVFDGEFAAHCEAVRAALDPAPLSVCLDAALEGSLVYEQFLADGGDSFVEADVDRDQPLSLPAIWRTCFPAPARTTPRSSSRRCRMAPAFMHWRMWRAARRRSS
jgi:fatty-acyl-CoA synthase